MNCSFGITQLLGVIYHFIPTRKIKHFDVIIINVGLIGDFALRYDTSIAYKKKFEGKKVLFICPKLIYPIVKDDPFFYEIWTYDLKKFMFNLPYFTQFVFKLKRISTDVLLFPAWERYRVGDIMVSFIKSKYTAGMKGRLGADLKRRYYNRYFTELIEDPEDNSEIGSSICFTKNIIDSSYQYGDNPLLISPTENIIIEGHYVVLAISSSQERKNWPIERYAEVVNLIPEKYKIVICGVGAGDKSKANKVISLADNQLRMMDFIDRTSVSDLIALISKSDFVIGNDSAAVHIACATRVPSICLLHGAHYKRFLPYPERLPNKKYHPRVIYYKMDCFQCDYRCIYKDIIPFECLKRVTVDMVKPVLFELLNELEKGM